MNPEINNTNMLFQCTGIDNNDDEKNSIYIPMTKNILYNFLYKLRSVFGRDDDLTANKRTWFDTQVRVTFP